MAHMSCSGFQTCSTRSSLHYPSPGPAAGPGEWCIRQVEGALCHHAPDTQLQHHAPKADNDKTYSMACRLYRCRRYRRRRCRRSSLPLSSSSSIIIIFIIIIFIIIAVGFYRRTAIDIEVIILPTSLEIRCRSGPELLHLCTHCHPKIIELWGH